MISTRSVGLLIDTVGCLTLAKWETVSGRFGGYFTSGKGVPILRFFLGLGIFTFRGGPRLFLWAGPRSLVMCFQVLPLFMLSIAVIQQNNVVLSFLVCQLLNKFLWPVFQ